MTSARPPSLEEKRSVARQAASLAVQLQRAGRVAEAEELYERALGLDPELTPAWCNLGVARRSRGDLDSAALAFARTLELDPRHAVAMSNLAALHEARNQPEEARKLARAALALSPQQAAPRLVMARLERAAGRPDAALGHLAMDAGSVPADLVPRLHTERGMALDRLGRCQEAFREFAAANLAVAASPASRAVDPQAYPRTVAVMRNRTPTLLATASSDPQPGAPPPVFVMGFPRSGTTLTETILSAHPGLRGSDELPLLESMLARLAQLLPGRAARYPDALMGGPLSPAEREILRDAYRAEAAALPPSPARLVDKLPLNLVHLGAIATVFPDAPLIVVLRDPRDVCLSCFMQDFVPNSAMVQMQSLERIVAMQEQVMGLWLESQPRLPNPVLVLRYEEVVSDQPAAARRLLAFLGLPWDERVARFWESARGVHISTPSHQDVARPIFTRARGRWRGYEEDLASVLPRLGELARALGYDGDPAETLTSK